MNLLHRFAEVSLVVIGDVMLDEYIWGDVRRISPEAPVPVVELRRRTFAPGGAGNAAANIASLHATPLLAGVVGMDGEAQSLREELVARGIKTTLIASEERPTSTKTRIVGASQQVLRIDREDSTDIPPEVSSALLQWAAEQLSTVDGMLISDYGKGVITSELCRELILLAKQADRPVVVDPKGRDYSMYSGATVVTPNVHEVHVAAEPLSANSGDFTDDVETLQTVLEGSSLLVTRGADGVSLFRSDVEPFHLAAQQRHVFDVTGAGDAFAATMALGVAAGGTLEEAAILANAAGGISVGKVGTGVVDLAELEAEVAALGQ